MSTAQGLRPRIPTGGRPVLPSDWGAAPALWLLYLLAVAALGIALADHRFGFRLFMAGMALTLLTLGMAVQLWVRSLTAGRVSVAASGPLRFVPPRYLWPTFIVVPVTLLIPGVISFVIALLGLPTMQGSTRLTTTAPYGLAIFSIILLARTLAVTRIPLGLRLDAEGLRGVRGSATVNLTWGEVAGASAAGPRGPRLALFTRAGATITIDAHYLGSDPAIVAAVVQHYLQHPSDRVLLERGADALHVVEATTADK